MTDTTPGPPVEAYGRTWHHGDFARDVEGRVWHLVSETHEQHGLDETRDEGSDFAFWIGTHFDADGTAPDQAEPAELPEPVTRLHLVEAGPSIPIAWMPPDFRRAAEKVVGAAGRMLDQWAERRDDPTRNQDLWTPLHRAADELGELLESVDRCSHGFPLGVTCTSGLCGDGSGTGVVVANDLMSVVLQHRAVERLAAELWNFQAEDQGWPSWEHAQDTPDVDAARRRAAEILPRFTPFIDRPVGRDINAAISASPSTPEAVEALAAILWNFSVGECRYGTARWEDWAPTALEDYEAIYTRKVARQTLAMLELADHPRRYMFGVEGLTAVDFTDVGHAEEGMRIVMSPGTLTATPLPPELPVLTDSPREVIRPIEPENNTS